MMVGVEYNNTENLMVWNFKF